MKSNTLILLAVGLIAGLAACSRNQPPADGLPISAQVATGTAAAPTATTTDVAPAVNSLVDFTVEPGVVYACDGRDRVVATVNWQVKDPAVTTVKVEVDTADDPMRKTFTAGGAVGEAVTEKWVGAGTRFYLVDAAGGKELASYEVTSLPCEG